MWLLDTNVVSELFKPAPAPMVTGWYHAARPEHLFATAISKAESLLGCALMPVGSRRDRLEFALRQFYEDRLATRVLPFSTQDADHFVEIVSVRRSLGKPVGEFDAQIAAIARSHGFAVVTRNVADFELCGIDIVNPWEPA